MIIKQQTYSAAIYCRLSVEDNVSGESGSISTQRTLLTQYCKDKGLNVSGFYVDDGYSGTTFDRPDFERMLNDIDEGKINLVLTKDLSRFGRDYIQAGYYIEKVFDSKNVRYIAVDDNIDTLNNNNDILGRDLLHRVTRLPGVFDEVHAVGLLDLFVGEVKFFSGHGVPPFE
jgi:site-specific DNA recombinase